MFWLLASAKRFGGAGHTKAEVYPPMAGQNTEDRIQNAEQFSILTS